MTPCTKLASFIAALLSATGLVAQTAAAVAPTVSLDRTIAVQRALIGGRARSVILFLGDGMGDSEITLARDYHVGAAGRLNMDLLPLTGEYTTYAVQESDPSLPDYVTDSAASATGWATGQKTSNGRIATAAGTSTVSPLRTVLERAQAAGFKTGDVSTAEITDATPAALASHVNDRGCQGPADMEHCPLYQKSAGGPGSIAEQLIDHRIDVILGGGRARFEQAIDAGMYAGKNVLQAAAAQGYTLVHDAAGMAGTTPGQRVLGLFAPGNMSLEWSGEPAKPYPGSGPQTCIEHQRAVNEPSLAAMTDKAIALLGGSKKGFFLQVEGASIDKQDHAANPCGQIGETVAFDAAIGVGLEYARRHRDTLIVVTADHAQASQIIEGVAPSENRQPGMYSVLKTADGALLTVSYSNAPAGKAQSHTGTEVRIAAQGPQAANVVGIIDQTTLNHILSRALGLE